jgi:uncharacterized membrane protein
MFSTVASIIPNPLHPAIVHLPVVLALLAPIAVFGSLYAIRRGARAVRAWGLSFALLAALSLSAWVATLTGEAEEDRVERVVPHDAFERHEEGGEQFLMLSLAVAAIGIVGFSRNRLGSAARIATGVGTIVLVATGYSVGHSGGQLVYQHGAASVYSNEPGGIVTRPSDH